MRMSFSLLQQDFRMSTNNDEQDGQENLKSIIGHLTCTAQNFMGQRCIMRVILTKDDIELEYIVLYMVK